MPSMNKKLRSSLLALIAALIWGTAFVAQDVCSDSIGSMTFNALRFFVAVVFLLAVGAILRFVRAKKAARLGVPNEKTAEEKRSYRRRLVIASVLCGSVLAAASVLQQAGLQFGTDSGKAGFITALYVVLVPICGIFLKKRVPGIFWLGVALAVAGLYLLCVSGDFKLAFGDLLTLLCAVAFTVQILLIDRFSPGLEGVDLCCGQFIVAGILSAAGMFLFEKPEIGAILSCALPLLYVAIFSSGVAYLLQILAQRGGNPSVITIIFSLEAVFSAIASAIILHQRMTAREYIGCVLLFAAVLIAQIPGKEEKEIPSEA